MQRCACSAGMADRMPQAVDHAACDVRTHAHWCSIALAWATGLYPRPHGQPVPGACARGGTSYSTGHGDGMGDGHWHCCPQHARGNTPRGRPRRGPRPHPRLFPLPEIPEPLQRPWCCACGTAAQCPGLLPTQSAVCLQPGYLIKDAYLIRQYRACGLKQRLQN